MGCGYDADILVYGVDKVVILCRDQVLVGGMEGGVQMVSEWHLDGRGAIHYALHGWCHIYDYVSRCYIALQCGRNVLRPYHSGATGGMGFVCCAPTIRVLPGKLRICCLGWGLYLRLFLILLMLRPGGWGSRRSGCQCCRQRARLYPLL